MAELTRIGAFDAALFLDEAALRETVNMLKSAGCRVSSVELNSRDRKRVTCESLEQLLSFSPLDSPKLESLTIWGRILEATTVAVTFQDKDYSCETVTYYLSGERETVLRLEAKLAELFKQNGAWYSLLGPSNVWKLTAPVAPWVAITWLLFAGLPIRAVAVRSILMWLLAALILLIWFRGQKVGLLFPGLVFALGHDAEPQSRIAIRRRIVAIVIRWFVVVSVDTLIAALVAKVILATLTRPFG